MGNELIDLAEAAGLVVIGVVGGVAKATWRRRQLSGEIVGSQHHQSSCVDRPFEEFLRCPFLDRIAQPRKLIDALIDRLRVLAFEIVHRRSADRAQDRFALIEQREINHHPIAVVAQYVASLQRHRKYSVPKSPSEHVPFLWNRADEECVLDSPQLTACISAAILIVAKLVNVSDTA
jgi:hypothetical protein